MSRIAGRQVQELENKVSILYQTIEELEHSPLPGVKFLEAQQRFTEMSKELSNDTISIDELNIDDALNTVGDT